MARVLALLTLVYGCLRGHGLAWEPGRSCRRIAVRRGWGGTSGCHRRALGLQQFERDRPYVAFGRGRLGGQVQRNSVSESHNLWSRMASLRATATRARLGPLVSASRRPQSRSAQGRLTRDSRTLAAS